MKSQEYLTTKHVGYDRLASPYDSGTPPPLGQINGADAAGSHTTLIHAPNSRNVASPANEIAGFKSDAQVIASLAALVAGGKYSRAVKQKRRSSHLYRAWIVAKAKAVAA